MSSENNGTLTKPILLLDSNIYTYEWLQNLRMLMEKENLDYYIFPNDIYGSEYISECDKRFKFFAGQAIVSEETAYLIIDPHYQLRTGGEHDENWVIIHTSSANGTHNWQSFILSRIQKDMRVGVSMRMISWKKATSFRTELDGLGAKLILHDQDPPNLILERPPRLNRHVFVHYRHDPGQSVHSKLRALRKWVFAHPPVGGVGRHVAALVTGLQNVAWLLNLIGLGGSSPFAPAVYAYLLISQDEATLFTECDKVTTKALTFLARSRVKIREYDNLWFYLAGAQWGNGSVIIADDVSYYIPQILPPGRFTITRSPSYVDEQRAIKNALEIKALKDAHLRDGASYVRWLAWLAHEMDQRCKVTEYDAMERLRDYKREDKHYVGCAYESISAAGRNSALLHYTPTKCKTSPIDPEAPYVFDSYTHYKGGTVKCTRSVHFGQPTSEQCKAFTRILQGHIAIDNAVFPQGTSGRTLGALMRNILQKEILNHWQNESRYDLSSSPSLSGDLQNLSADTPLVPGHIIANGSGYSADGKWGLRMQSSLLVKKVEIQHSVQDCIWLIFERLTVVPIQMKMVDIDMLSRDEKNWIEEHNKNCFKLLEKYIGKDTDALKWLDKETKRTITKVKPHEKWCGRKKSNSQKITKVKPKNTGLHIS